jgi:hypothetical protein
MPVIPAMQGSTNRMKVQACQGIKITKCKKVDGLAQVVAKKKKERKFDFPCST